MTAIPFENHVHLDTKCFRFGMIMEKTRSVVEQG